MSGAAVELIGADERLGRRQTDEQGSFRFEAGPALGRATGVLVRRIGYAPIRRDFSPRDSLLVIVLTPLPAALPTVRILSNSRECPNRDEPRARELWSAAAGGYSPGYGVTLAASARTGRATVDSASMGWAAAEGGHAHGMQSRAGGLWARRTRREGYVWELPERHIYQDFGAWEYPPLDRDFAWHFADSAFAAAHAFSVAAESAHEVEVRFCPRRGASEGLAGTLVLSRAGAFLSARWTFFASKRDREHAGGEVAFAPVVTRDGRKSPLLPVAGLFWRRLSWGGYYQRWAEYDDWRVLPWDSMDKARE